MRSNHKNLVNACYPPQLNHIHPTSIVLNPLPNPLSKLLYYCHSRPHKAQKVAAYLLSYANAQARPPSLLSSLSVYRHSKPGLICTINIFLALLKSSPLTVSLIPNHVLQIIAIALGLLDQLKPDLQSPGYFGNQWLSSDLAITSAAIDLFAAFAERLTPECLQDDQVSRNYLFLLAKFSSVAMVAPSIPDQPTPEPEPPSPAKSARALALVALHSALLCPGLDSSAHFTNQIRVILPGLLASIFPADQRDPDALLDMVQRYPLDQTPQDLISQTNKYRSLALSFSPEAKPLATEPDLVYYSTTMVQMLLSSRLTSLSQFELCLRVMLSRLEATMPLRASAWFTWFGGALLVWAPPRHRPLVVELLADRLGILDAKRLRAPEPAPLARKMVILAGLLLALLTHPAALGLLNVTRLLDQLVQLLRSACQAATHGLRDAFVALIGALGAKVYYDTQIDDLVQALLAHLTHLLQNTPAYDHYSATALLAALNATLTSAHAAPPKHHPISLASWTDSLPLLARLNDWPSRHVFTRALWNVLRLEAFGHGKAVDGPQLVRFLAGLCVVMFEEHTSVHHESTPVVVSGVIPGPDMQSPSLEVMGDGKTIKDCVVEALGHKHWVAVAVCVPVLREMDRVEVGKRDEVGDGDVVGDCLIALGTTWGISCLAGEVRDEAEWARMVQVLSGDEGIQRESGMSEEEVAKVLNESWTVEEGKKMVEGGQEWMVIKKSGKLVRQSSSVSKLSGNRLLKVSPLRRVTITRRGGGLGASSKVSLNGQEGLSSPTCSGKSLSVLGHGNGGAKKSPSVNELREVLLANNGFHQTRSARRSGESIPSTGCCSGGTYGGGGGGGESWVGEGVSSLRWRDGGGGRNERVWEVLEKVRVVSENKGKANGNGHGDGHGSTGSSSSSINQSQEKCDGGGAAAACGGGGGGGGEEVDVGQGI